MSVQTELWPAVVTLHIGVNILTLITHNVGPMNSCKQRSIILNRLYAAHHTSAKENPTATSGVRCGGRQQESFFCYRGNTLLDNLGASWLTISLPPFHLTHTKYFYFKARMKHTEITHLKLFADMSLSPELISPTYWGTKSKNSYHVLPYVPQFYCAKRQIRVSLLRHINVSPCHSLRLFFFAVCCILRSA